MLTYADLASAQAGVVQAQTALDTAQAALAAATLAAPFAGTVAEVKVDPGAPVGPNTTVLTLVDTSTLHVDVDLSESDVARVAPGQGVDLHLRRAARPGAHRHCQFGRPGRHVK